MSATQSVEQLLLQCSCNEKGGFVQCSDVIHASVPVKHRRHSWLPALSHCVVLLLFGRLVV